MSEQMSENDHTCSCDPTANGGCEAARRGTPELCSAVEATTEKAAPRRPLRTRIWFDKPWLGYLKPEDGFYLSKGWWKPWSQGCDEFNWHTLALGNPVTGRVVIAYKRCPGTGSEACVEHATLFPEEFARDWPIDAYGHNTVGKCAEPDCYCESSDNSSPPEQTIDE